MGRHGQAMSRPYGGSQRMGTGRGGREMVWQCKGGTYVFHGGPRGPNLGSHTDQEVTLGGEGGGRNRTMRLYSLMD